MKQYKTGRVLAALFLGVLFGLYRHFQQMRWLEHGREYFLTQQNNYFDKITQYHSAVQMLIAGIILAAIALGLYEFIAAAIAHILPPSTVEE